MLTSGACTLIAYGLCHRFKNRMCYGRRINLKRRVHDVNSSTGACMQVGVAGLITNGREKCGPFCLFYEHTCTCARHTGKLVYTHFYLCVCARFGCNISHIKCFFLICVHLHIEVCVSTKYILVQYIFWTYTLSSSTPDYDTRFMVVRSCAYSLRAKRLRAAYILYIFM